MHLQHSAAAFLEVQYFENEGYIQVFIINICFSNIDCSVCSVRLEFLSKKVFFPIIKLQIAFLFVDMTLKPVENLLS